MGLPCMNCKQPVKYGHAEFFQGVYLCPICFELADKFHKDGVRELKNLMTLFVEGIRLALVRGQFHFGPGGTEQVSKNELLRTIVRMEELRRTQAVENEQASKKS